MPERGGATTQAGIYYQNTVAARHLADLLDLSPLSPRERVVEVRLEAPAHVDALFCGSPMAIATGFKPS
jgi:hypothetical protein